MVMAAATKYTAALLHHRKNRINHRLIFGKPVDLVRLDWQRSLAVFQPDQIFGYIRWRANKYGTQQWQVYVLQAVNRGSITCVPGIYPGANSLVATTGKARVQRLLGMLDQQTSAGLDHHRISPAYWRHVHLMLLSGEEPHLPSRVQFMHLPLAERR